MNMYEVYNKNGFNQYTGLYKSRYYAAKAARGDEVIVKVEGGYKIMKVTEWAIRKKQL